MTHRQDQVDDLYKILIKAFGTENVKFSSSYNPHIKVRPMWISESGYGFKPDINTMINLVSVHISDFINSKNYQTKTSMLPNGIICVSLYEFQTQELDDTYPLCDISLHHSMFF